MRGARPNPFSRSQPSPPQIPYPAPPNTHTHDSQPDFIGPALDRGDPAVLSLYLAAHPHMASAALVRAAGRGSSPLVRAVLGAHGALVPTLSFKLASSNAQSRGHTELAAMLGEMAATGRR